VENRFGANSDAVLDAYQPGQNPRQFLSGFQNAYILGTQGNQAALQNSKAAAYLTQEQKQIAYELGVQSTTQDSTELAGYMSEADMPEDRYSLQNTVENNGESATIVDENARIHEDKLMAMEIPQRATAIEGILKQYTDKESRWKGTTIIKKADEMGKTRGRKLWTCAIEVREDAGIKTLIHELLHARSASNKNVLAYSRWQDSEEAAVELFAQEICKKNGIAYEGAYPDRIKRLTIIRNILYPHGDPYIFAKEFYETDMLERYDWLKKQADDLIASGVLSGKTQEILCDMIDTFKRRVTK